MHLKTNIKYLKKQDIHYKIVNDIICSKMLKSQIDLCYISIIYRKHLWTLLTETFGIPSYWYASLNNEVLMSFMNFKVLVSYLIFYGNFSITWVQPRKRLCLPTSFSIWRKVEPRKTHLTSSAMGIFSLLKSNSWYG